MKLDDLLYYLHHPEALDQLDHQALASLIRQYPYLESLKSAYYKKYPGHNVVHNDLNEKLSTLVQSGFSDGQDILLPPVFDLNPVFDLKDETTLNPAEVDIETPNLTDPLNVIASEEVIHKPVYAYTESGFVSYLKTLPACKVPRPAAPFPELKEDSIKQIHEEHHELEPIQIQQTEELIKSSLDLRDSIGSESLADLWASQGKPELAIQIYEKLLAENPEKSTIFAAKIEKLKAEYSL
ncbi:MAG: hypothetical protein ABIR66_12340 [Saprospiraceae bacterium]